MDDEIRHVRLSEMYNVDRAVVELTANLLRVIRGSGQPHLLVRQIAVCDEVFKRHWDQHKVLPEAEIVAALDTGFRGFPPSRLLVANESRHHALTMMIDGALQVAASTIQPHPLSLERGMDQLRSGAREFNEPARGATSGGRP